MKDMKTGGYSDHYYSLGSIIRDTVRYAQNALCGLQLGSISRRLRDYYDPPGQYETRKEICGKVTFGDGTTAPLVFTKIKANVHPAGLPQSLGELCIEVAQDSFRNRQRWNPPARILYEEKCRRDIQELRTKMYHKHIDPKQERLYRLIDLVRTA
jgi:hypothetical protein